MKTTKYFTIYFILILTHGLSQSLTTGQNLMPPNPLGETEELGHMPLNKYDNSASDSRYDDFLSNINASSNSRDGRAVYTFTTCGQSGRFGPSQNQANVAYSGSNTSVTVNNGIQEWTVPASGNYVIEAYGARGGNGAQYAIGDHGEGAYVVGTFALYEGDKLQILVGQEGSYDNTNRYGGGGGGGSFVALGASYGNANPLIIAGGGGGGGYNSGNYVNGQTGTSGSNGGAGSYSSYSGPGIGGWNGMGATGSSTFGGNAGGFYSNGSGNRNHFSEAGVGFRNGGNGGNGQYGGRGGFGGGAGGYGGAGGGGGYSGGGGGAWAYGGAGGGGGSYNNGLNQSNLAGSNNSHGLIVITSSDVLTNTAPTATAQTVTGNEDETQTITLIGSDVDGDNLTYELASNPLNGTTSLSGNVVTYTPTANFNGYDNFYFTVSDGEATSETATVHIILTAVNDAPTASVLSASGSEDETQTITLVGNDVDSDDLTYVLVNDPSHGIVSLNSGDASTTHSTADFIDPENVNNRLSLSSTGWEGSGAWTHSSGIYVGPHVSVQPTGFSTPDGDGYFVRNYPGQSTSKYAITKAGTSTIPSNERGNITFTADWAANRSLGARFVAIVNGTWYASDQFGMANNAHGNMNQTRVTDWEVDESVSADTDNWYVSLAGSPSGYAWRDGNQWSTTPVPGGGLPAGDITQFGMAWLQTGNGDYGAVDNFRVINNGGGSGGAEVTYTPNQNYNGPDSFTYTVSDGEATSESSTVTINVLPVNDVPTINSIPALNIIEGEPYEYFVSINDLDGDQVSLSVPVKPDWLNLENGSLVGTPSLNDGGLHSVVLNANDGNGGIVFQEYVVSVAVRHLEISGESGFRILSSPISGPIFGDLLEELWTQGSEGSDHEGADPNVWTFHNEWVPVSDLYNDHLEAGKGFAIYVFADTDYDGNDDLPVTIGVDGTVNESSVSVSSNASEWNLVGNPYGLHVNISQLLSDNSSTFHSTVYRKDDINPGYQTHNGIVGDINEGLIKPFDGFWVQAGPEGHSFDFSEHCMQKGHMVYSGGARSVTSESTGSATFTFSNGEFTSSVYLSFTGDGEINLDPSDAKRIIPMSPAEHLTSMVRESSKSLSINNLPYALTTDLALEVDVMLLNPNEEGYETQSGQVNLTWDIMDLPDGISLTLVNNFTGQNINLYGFPSANINLPSKGGFTFPDEIMQSYPFVDEAQFSLHVSSDFATSKDDEKIIPDEITLHNAYPNPFNPSTMISFEMIELDEVSLNIFDLAGRQVASLINNEVMTPGHHKISWNPGLLPSGVYLVELVTSVKSFNQKITYIK